SRQMAIDAIDRRENDVALRFVHAGMHRQLQALSGRRLRVWEFGVTVMIRRLQMGGHHATSGSNLFSMQSLHQSIAIEWSMRTHAHLKALPIRRDVIRHIRWSEELVIGETGDVTLRHARTSCDEIIKAVELTQAYGRLDIGDAEIVAHLR